MEMIWSGNIYDFFRKVRITLSSQKAADIGGYKSKTGARKLLDKMIARGLIKKSKSLSKEVFAVCDYYLQGKAHRNARHFYKEDYRETTLKLSATTSCFSHNPFTCMIEP